jgi:enterochelin esterase-like enzyme
MKNVIQAMNHTLILIAAVLFAPLTTIAQERQTPSWTTSPIRAPRVEFRTFQSQAVKTAVSFHVFTPEIYDKEKERRFPVLYWLHGSGGGEKGIAPLSAFFDRAIREGRIAPMLVVFPHGMAASMWCDSKDGAVPMETVVTRELVPHIDATFRTLATREARMIEGFSMGGYGAARLGLKNPKLFGAVSILAGGPLDLDFAGPRAAGNPAERERILNGTFGGDLDYYRAIHPITVARQQADAVRGKMRMRIVAGARDNTGPLNRAYSDHLKKLNIAHTFTIVPGVGHETLPLLTALGEENWQFYRSSLGSSSATPTPPSTSISHRLLITDYSGNRVCIVSAAGEIEWEYPATTPQDCWLLANGNVLFSQSTGAVEVTRDKKVVWQYTVQCNFFRNVMPGIGNPPANLDGDVLLGPAPQRRYNANRALYHFRWFWDYSGGQMTNLGHHSLDIVHWIFDIAAPKAVSSSGRRFFLKDNGEGPDTQDAIIEYPKFNTVVQFRECAAGAGASSMGALTFMGTKGTMTLGRDGFEILHDKKIDPVNAFAHIIGGHPVGGPQPAPEPEGDFWCERAEDKTGDWKGMYVEHAKNFLDCVKSRKTPNSDLASSHWVSTTCHLANISARTGRKILWDATANDIAGDKEASAMLQRPYRAPWDAELKAVLA